MSKIRANLNEKEIMTALANYVLLRRGDKSNYHCDVTVFMIGKFPDGRTEVLAGMPTCRVEINLPEGGVG